MGFESDVMGFYGPFTVSLWDFQRSKMKSTVILRHTLLFFVVFYEQEPEGNQQNAQHLFRKQYGQALNILTPPRRHRLKSRCSTSSGIGSVEET